jgi:hypothetical protein
MNQVAIDFFNKNKYVHVQNVIDKKLALTAALYCLLNEKKNKEHGIENYKDPLMESILQIIQPIVEEHIGKELVPSYGHYTVYKNTQKVLEQKERMGSDISVSMCLGYDYRDDIDVWPFSVNGTKIQLRQKDMVIYSSDLKISRPNFDNYEDYFQVDAFLNYTYKDKVKNK